MNNIRYNILMKKDRVGIRNLDLDRISCLPTINMIMLLANKSMPTFIFELLF